MSANEVKHLAATIRGTWKQLALADQADADELLEILKGLLESLEALEVGAGI